MGAHFLAMKDMAGLLKPFAAAKLVKALRRRWGSRSTSTPTTPPAWRGHAPRGGAGRGGRRGRRALVALRPDRPAEPELARGGAGRDASGIRSLDQDGLQQLANYWETVRD